MTRLTGTVCPNCHESGSLELKADEAAHDSQTIEMVIECNDCEARYDYFAPLEEFNPIE
ncbi:hypothetical protein [Enterobacter asburiae]|uniref:hypothetical protein n=1 Tax=Enterobacter asburiae TaxID=61645 RepID=UPI0012B835C2|nr:hypothetical protein [Enterobacter asburiae]